MKPDADIRTKARRKHARRLAAKNPKPPLPQPAPAVPVLLIDGKVVQAAPVLLPVRSGSGFVWRPNPEFSMFATKLKADRVARERAAETLGKIGRFLPDENTGRAVKPKTRWPSVPQIIRLIKQGYPFKAAVAALPASSPLNTIATDRHRSNPEKMGAPSHLQSVKPIIVAKGLSRRDLRRSGLSTRKAADGRIPEGLLMSLLQASHYDLPMQAALRDTLVVGRRVADVARERRLDRRKLSDATRKLRKQALDS